MNFPMLAQFPTLQSGAIETWLLSAAAVAVIAGSINKLLPKQQPQQPPDSESVHRDEFREELTALRDRIDSRHLAVMDAIEQLRNDLLAEDHQRQARLSAIEASLARLDERTRS